MEKQKKLKILLIISFSLMIVATVVVGLLSINKTKDYNININSQNAPEEIEGDPQVHSVNMLLNELSKVDEISVSGSKVKITLPEGLRLSAYNATTNGEISIGENNIFEVPEDGAKLKIDGVTDGQKYDIEIEQEEVSEEYISRFKSAIIEINAESGELVSFVKKITKNVNGQDVETEGSDAQTAIFMYEDDENHNIKIKENSDVELYYYTSSLSNELSDEEVEGVEWSRYDKENGLKLEKNCIVYSKSKYKTGEYSEISRINVTNIDKIAPSIEVTTKSEEEYETSIQVKITEEETEEYGASGIIGYALTEDDEEPSEYTECENSTTVETQIDEITANGKYYLWAKDEAGNVGKKEFEVTNVEVRIVAIILGSPFEELNGTEYESLISLLATLKEKEESATLGEAEKVIIQMVNDDKNETVEFDDENVDIVLDLNGYTISSKVEDEATVTVKSGNLQVVDNKYTISDYITESEKLEYLQNTYSANSEEYGKIRNSKYIGIEVLNGAVFTLGEDDRTVSIVNPVIEGLEKGIYNRGGEFNYFDGLIIGKSTIEGTITSTPAIYDPTVSQTEIEGVFQSYLAKVSGVEAVIGKTRYTKLETAIDVANKTTGTSEEQVQIDIVTDIMLDETRGTTDDVGEIMSAGSLIVDESKNIILNLNGYSITNSVTNYIIKNSGKLEIIDSSLDEVEDKSTISGKISSTTYDIIYNTGELKFTSGAIVLNKKGESENYCKAINNEGKISIKDGKIEIYNQYNCGIYNNSEEVFYMTGGIITTYGYMDYGIFSNGTLIMNDGNILSNESGSYGIYNTGNLTVNGGSIKTNYSSSPAIYNVSNLYVTGGNIIANGTSSYGVYNISDAYVEIKDNANIYTYTDCIRNEGRSEIKGGKLEATRYGALWNNGSSGNAEITGGELIGKEYAVTVENSATTVINGGTITGSERGIDNERGNLEIKSGKIYGDTSYGVYHNYGTVNISGGEINSNKKSGVFNERDGIITITGGTISSKESYGVYNEEDGTITIGNDEDEDVSQDSPKITGATYGIYNPYGIFNFYDGVITASSDNSIFGIIEDIPEGYEVNFSKRDNLEEAKLLAETKVVAKVDDIEFTSIKEAFDYCNENFNGEEKIITMVDNALISISDRRAVVNEGIKIKLDLSGKTITTYTSSKAIVNNGNFELTDSGENGQIISKANGIIENGSTGILIIEKGSLIQSLLGTSNKEIDIIINYGQLNISGGNITSSVSNVTAIDNKGTGKIEISDVALEVKSIAIDNYSVGQIKITGGTIKGVKYGVYNRSTGTIEILGGTIYNASTSGSDSGIYNEEAGKIVLNGGNIYAKQYGIFNKSDGKVEIKAGNVNSTSRNVIYNIASGSVLISGGNVTSSSSYSVIENHTGTVEITGGTIEGYGDGIYNYSTGTVTVSGGTIKSNRYCGIKNISTGTIILGEKDGNVSTQVPFVSGYSYGVYNNKGTFDFYDGKIEGSSGQSIYGTITDIEVEYDVKKYKNGESETYEVASGREISVLEQNEFVMVESSGKKYTSLVKALAETEATDKLIILEDSTIIESIASVEIAEGKDITLDLAGYTLTASNENTIINNGKLTITDSSTEKTGTLRNTKNTAIKNNEQGNVILTGGTISAGESGTSDEYKKIIVNSGTFTVSGGTISATKSYIIGIDNIDTGEVEITGGTINLTSNGYGILNESTKDIKICDGEIICYDYGIYNSNIGNIEMTGGIIDNSSVSWRRKNWNI